jgi:hypothetical protein
LKFQVVKNHVPEGQLWRNLYCTGNLGGLLCMRRMSPIGWILTKLWQLEISGREEPFIRRTILMTFILYRDPRRPLLYAQNEPDRSSINALWHSKILGGGKLCSQNAYIFFKILDLLQFSYKIIEVYLLISSTQLNTKYFCLLNFM